MGLLIEQLDSTSGLLTLQIYSRPNPSLNPRWQPRTKMCTHAPIICLLVHTFWKMHVVLNMIINTTHACYYCDLFTLAVEE